jgi:hypothetical protein
MPRKNALKLMSCKRVVLALALGVSLTLITTGLLVALFMPSSWTTVEDVSLSDAGQTYIAQSSPPLRAVMRAVPADSQGELLFRGLNLGIDFVSYNYGLLMWDDDYEPWDPSVDTEPQSIELTRYRFGWPMRVLSFDDITTGSSVNDPRVLAYHQKAYTLAGKHRGLDRPAWLPGFIPLYRVPIAANWLGGLVNVLTWAAIVYALLSTKPLFRRWIERKRSRLGLCVECKYPLNDFEQCPECGTQRA